MRGNLSITIIAAEESGVEANVIYNDIFMDKIIHHKTAHAIHLLKIVYLYMA